MTVSTVSVGPRAAAITTHVGAYYVTLSNADLLTFSGTKDVLGLLPDHLRAMADELAAALAAGTEVDA